MAIHVQCIALVCSGYLIVTMVQADTIQKSLRLPADNISVDSVKIKAVPSVGIIDQDLMNIVSQLMYGKTTGDVIDELVYTYDGGKQATTPLANVAQILSQQLGYLSLAIESAQAIISVLPPTSPPTSASTSTIVSTALNGTSETKMATTDFSV